MLRVPVRSNQHKYYTHKRRNKAIRFIRMRKERIATPGIILNYLNINNNSELFCATFWIIEITITYVHFSKRNV